MSVWIAKVGDLHRRIALDLEGIETTGASSVRFRMRLRDSSTLTVDANGVIDSATRVSYQFTGAQLDVAGVYLLEVVLIYPDGAETVPTSGQIQVLLEPHL